jgi:hypothetical protein
MIAFDEDLRRAKIEERERALAKLLGRLRPGIVANEYFEAKVAVVTQRPQPLRQTIVPIFTGWARGTPAGRSDLLRTRMRLRLEKLRI